MEAIIIIPARLASTRLPDKPLADIGGRPMIAHVVERSLKSKVGPVVVAAADGAIARAAESAGARAILTDPDHPSGSDRVYEALLAVDPDERFDVVINIQGDLPGLNPDLPKRVVTPLSDPAVDISTLATIITDPREKGDPAVVKIALAPSSRDSHRALYFSRATIPHGDGPHYHHIGIYAYRRAALERFVSLRPGTLEESEKLEQLRALEAGMRIDVALVDTRPLPVDTPADLERARKALSHGSATILNGGS